MWCSHERNPSRMVDLKIAPIVTLVCTVKETISELTKGVDACLIDNPLVLRCHAVYLLDLRGLRADHLLGVLLDTGQTRTSSATGRSEFYFLRLAFSRLIIAIDLVDPH